MTSFFFQGCQCLGSQEWIREGDGEAEIPTKRASKASGARSFQEWLPKDAGKQGQKTGWGMFFYVYRYLFLFALSIIVGEEDRHFNLFSNSRRRWRRQWSLQSGARVCQGSRSAEAFGEKVNDHRVAEKEEQHQEDILHSRLCSEPNWNSNIIILWSPFVCTWRKQYTRCLTFLFCVRTSMVTKVDKYHT